MDPIVYENCMIMPTAKYLKGFYLMNQIISNKIFLLPFCVVLEKLIVCKFCYNYGSNDKRMVASILLMIYSWKIWSWGHLLSTYAKFSEKLAFLTLWYAHLRIRIRGVEMLVFPKILRMYLMDDLHANQEMIIAKLGAFCLVENSLCNKKFKFDKSNTSKFDPF